MAKNTKTLKYDWEPFLKAYYELPQEQRHDFFDGSPDGDMRRCLNYEENHFHPIHLAARHHMTDLCQSYLDAGIDVNLQSNGCTPLYLAIEHVSNKEYPHWRQTCKLLLDRGADPLIFARSLTPFHLASWETERAALFIDLNLDPNFPPSPDPQVFKGVTPFLIAAEKVSPEVFQRYIDHGGDIHYADGFGKTAFFHAVENGNLPTAKLLVERGADYSNVNPKGVTPLHAVASDFRKATDVIDWLVQDLGFHVDILDKRKNTPLLIAAQNGNTEKFKTLIKLGANINAQNSKKETALHLFLNSFCAESGIECFQAILDSGIDPLIKNKKEELPIDLARNSSCLNKYIEPLEKAMAAAQERNAASKSESKDVSSSPVSDKPESKKKTVSSKKVKSKRYTINDLIKFIEMNPDLSDMIYCGSPVSSEVISEAEKMLDLKFPESYKKFLEQYGSMEIVGAISIYGIGVSDPHLHELTDSAVHLTLELREETQLPHYYLAFYNNEGDEQWCLDTRKENASIIIWNYFSKDIERKYNEDFVNMIFSEIKTAINFNEEITDEEKENIRWPE